jgi:hypothetical protein
VKGTTVASTNPRSCDRMLRSSISLPPCPAPKSRAGVELPVERRDYYVESFTIGIGPVRRDWAPLRETSTEAAGTGKNFSQA